MQISSILIFAVLAAIASVCVLAMPLAPVNTPEQIHLALTGSPSQMLVMFVTQQPASPSVKIGVRTGAYYFIANGTSAQYTYDTYTSGYIHTVLVDGLKAKTKYFYVVGDMSQGFSSEYTFTTQTDSNEAFTVGVIGDLGYTSNSVNTVNGILSDDHTLAAVWHVGDLSYANGNQPIWDQWSNMVQPAAATIPWMVGVGNHENYHNFTAYDYRFQMPNSPGGNLFWTYRHSFVQLVVLSTESDYSANSLQYNWFVNVMSNIDRSVTPWVIVMFHRPFYNSNWAHQGEAIIFGQIYEPLFYKYKVDLCISGHVHAYERSHRVYNNVVNNSQYPTQYITIGDGGNQEGLATGWISPQPNYSAFRMAKYGYGRLEVFNATHIDWTWHTNPTTNSYNVEDETWIVRPFPR